MRNNLNVLLSKVKYNQIFKFLVLYRYPSLSYISAVSIWGVGTQMSQLNYFLRGLTVSRSSKWGRNEVCGKISGNFNSYQGAAKPDNFKIKNLPCLGRKNSNGIIL